MLALHITKREILEHLRDRMREWQEDHADVYAYAAELSEPELRALAALAATRIRDDLPQPVMHYIIQALNLTKGGE